MSLVGKPAHNHPQQTARFGPERALDGYETNPELFAALDKRFRFSIDVAASSTNRKCAQYFDVQTDGLAQDWAGHRVWCNPPYSSVRPWVEKAWRESYYIKLIVMLVPANRTEQRWWQELVEPYRDRGLGLTTEFLPGRLRFIRAGKDRVGTDERPPFGCVLLRWDPRPASAPRMPQERFAL